MEIVNIPCPCIDCDIRGSENCDHGLKCPRGYATYEFYRLYKKAKVDKARKDLRMEIEYELDRDKRIKRKMK